MGQVPGAGYGAPYLNQSSGFQGSPNAQDTLQIHTNPTADFGSYDGRQPHSLGGAEQYPGATPGGPPHPTPRSREARAYNQVLDNYGELPSN